ncbi:MAG: hypothetical protein PUP93_31230 [Rhizonema sp. NSF051]|nr:hypothetical protein [Rhizonema sp. NSF051]
MASYDQALKIKPDYELAIQGKRILVSLDKNFY